jgi:hypothetical protein
MTFDMLETCQEPAIIYKYLITKDLNLRLDSGPLRNSFRNTLFASTGDCRLMKCPMMIQETKKPGSTPVTG